MNDRPVRKAHHAQAAIQRPESLWLERVQQRSAGREGQGLRGDRYGSDERSAIRRAILHDHAAVGGGDGDPSRGRAGELPDTAAAEGRERSIRRFVRGKIDGAGAADDPRTVAARCIGRKVDVGG